MNTHSSPARFSPGPSHRESLSFTAGQAPVPVDNPDTAPARSVDSGFLPQLTTPPRGIGRNLPPGGTVRSHTRDTTQDLSDRRDYDYRRGLAHRDMVIPRVYIEPDAMLDQLKRSALRFAIFRDGLFMTFLCLGIIYLAGILVVGR